MSIQRKYPIEIEERILSEYRQGTNGYTKIAKEYGLSRDNVRNLIRRKKK